MPSNVASQVDSVIPASIALCRRPRTRVSLLPEVRECIRDATPITNTTRGGRRARHPKTTLPHRPPGPLAADRIVGGRPRAPARSGGG
eukprot:scaffold37713_cov104-Phaeocystis_antarctica.AAC.1